MFRYADSRGRAIYTIAFLGAIASGAALPLMTIIFGSFTTKFGDFSTGAVSPAEFKKDVNRFVLYYVYLFLARFIIVYVSTVLVMTASIRTTKSLRQAFLASILRKEIWYFDMQKSRSIATQVTTNGNKITQGTADKLFLFVQAISTFFSAFIIALAVQWKLALIALTCVPLIFILLAVAIGIDSIVESKVTQIFSHGAAIAQESISSVSTVQAFWAQNRMIKKYGRYLQLAHKQGNHKSPLLGIVFSTEFFCSYSAIALAFWQGFRMYQSSQVSNIGPVFTVVLCTLIAASSVSLIVPHISALTSAASAASELFSVIDRDSELDPFDPAGTSPPSCIGSIEVRDLTFAYPSRPSFKVLSSLSLNIPAGKTTALVGPSGCGKSTLVGLLERWYNPKSGQLLLDGQDLSSYNTKWLRSNIRLVQQEPILFSGSVYDNVAKGLLDEQRLLPANKQFELVQDACKASNAHNFILKLPEGYDTQLGESAGMLSGGQRQRLAIARSIISDPKILLLDEATSALDPRAESVVQHALQRVSHGRTVLVIAHKLATIKNADNIAVISNGLVVEQGTHDQLIERGNSYAALVRAQDLGHDDQRSGKPSTEDEDELGLDEKSQWQVDSLKKIESAGRSKSHDPEEQAVARGTIGLSLISCIYRILKEQKSIYPWFALSTVGVLIGGATYPGQALLFAKLIGVFTQKANDARNNANFYSLMLFVIAIGNLVGYFIVGWTCNVIGQTVAHHYRSEMFATMLKQDREFFDQIDNHSGSLVSRLETLPSQLQDLLSANILLVLTVVVNLLSSCALALAYGWKLGLVVIGGGLPPLLLTAYIRTRLEQRLAVQIEQRFYKSASLAMEAVTAIKTVASLTLETGFLDEYSTLLANIAKTTILSTLHTMFWAALAQSLEFLMMALGFWYGGHLLANGEYTAEQFFIIFLAVLFSGQAAAQFTSYSTSLSKAADAANYIFWLRTLKPSITETEENRNQGPDDDNDDYDDNKNNNQIIELQNVHFRYKQRTTLPVLRGVSMKISPGESIAFVGASGCGKSTLISLLERLYDPTTGCICLSSNNNKSNKDIRTLSPRLYRQRISLVQQQPILFSGSIRENIALALEHDASDEDILEACRQANILTFIQSLPEGLGTKCGSQGLQFSGGQRQRIAIARALIRQPRLLLLDEATSALDTQSERLVQATLDEAGASRTMVSVAHRLSTVRNADVIFVVDGGKIVEAGRHEELLSKKGVYYGMCLTQSLDRADV